MGTELCVDEAAVAMAVTEALERPGSVSVGRKSVETVRSRRRFADRCTPPARAAIGAGANLLRPGGRGRGDREPVGERGGLEVAHERSNTRAEEVDGRRVRERLPTGAAARAGAFRSGSGSTAALRQTRTASSARAAP